MIYLHIFDDSFDICRSLVQLLLMGSQVFSEVGRIQQAVGWGGNIYIKLTDSQAQIVSIEYTGSLATADFSGAVFTCAHFQKIAQKPAYAIFII